jgi:prephenate dehydrogenase
MKSVGIIGFGRFGKILAKIFGDEYELFVFDPQSTEKSDYLCSDIAKVLQANMIFLSVPIRKFENVVEGISKYKLHNTTIVDVCSVKVYPVKVMKKYLPSNVGIIATHPLFGPDSFSSFRELKMMACPIRDLNDQYIELKDFLLRQSIQVVEMTPEAHDRKAAMSQGITHFIGRALNESGVKSTTINTLGFNDLLGVIEQTCNDSWELFKDLQNYNPYTDEMVHQLEDAIKRVRKNIKLSH